MDIQIKREKRLRRAKRIRSRIQGSAERPRLSVFRSSKHIYAQLINDEKKETLIAASDRELKSMGVKIKTSKKTAKDVKIPIRTGKTATAFKVGKLIAEKALENKIKEAVFDRGFYKYHGRVKALAEGAREAGLKF